jgi:hypothetical protein
VEVFYRRFIEAWITTINVETMLGWRQDIALPGGRPKSSRYEAGLRSPPFKSKNGGFIAEFERPAIEEELKKAQVGEWDAEALLVQVVRRGDTLRYAKAILSGFAVVAVFLAAVILYAAFAPPTDQRGVSGLEPITRAVGDQPGAAQAPRGNR